MMVPSCYTLFDSAIGTCGIAWGDRGVVAVQLPEASEFKTRARLLKRFPDAQEASAPPHVQRAIDGIVALLRGEASDLSASCSTSTALNRFNDRSTRLPAPSPRARR
jgi:methylated-DNA-[protein]-cysteine S-methyltransferase